MPPSPDRPSARRRSNRGDPAPATAGANLLVHDLKGMACRLGLLLQNLDEHYDDPLFKQTVLDVLDGAVVHLQRLARDLRDHDSQLLVKLRLDLRRVMQDALVNTRTELCGDVKLVERYSEVPLIWGDGFMLRCAFTCAIENALEAMHGEGMLTVSIRPVRRKGRQKITVEIADTGPGMSDEFMREHLFQPFVTTKEDGMGMGAYTFRQVAAFHGGSVRILSEQGRGTRVRFHFPCD